MPAMLFGLFSKKQDHIMDDVQSSPKLSTIRPTNSDSPASEPVQLRTPSPSVESAIMNVAGPSTPPPISSTPNIRNRPMSPLRNSLSQLAVRSDSDTASPDSTAQDLHRLISSVPAKTLHSYTLTYLHQTPPSTLAALTSFYSNLQPPPKLHCVRCHKDYMEVENDDRSCLVPHDDDSALVERVGRSVKARGGAESGAEYETLWQCCGKTVEGDGDQGPPDGWCYEGKHTTDVKRARFRADSTTQDDKLVSCFRKNCNDVQSQLRKVKSTRNKRNRSYIEIETTDEESSARGSRMDLEGSVDAIGSVRGRSKRKASQKSPKEIRAQSTDARTDAKPTTQVRRATSVSAKPKSRRKHVPKNQESEEDEEKNEEDKRKKRRKVA